MYQSHTPPPPRQEVPEGGSSEHFQWRELIERIREDDDSAVEELYRVLSRGTRFLLCRQLGPDEAEDRLHNVFLIVVKAIRNGRIQDPERLMGYVRTVARRQITAAIADIVRARKQGELSSSIADRKYDVQRQAEHRQKVEIMAATLREMSPRDREILSRFYLDEQSPEQICQEMRLSATQFRLLKSRAKERFSDKGRKKAAQSNRSALMRQMVYAR